MNQEAIMRRTSQTNIRTLELLDQLVDAIGSSQTTQHARSLRPIPRDPAGTLLKQREAANELLASLIPEVSLLLAQLRAELEVAKATPLTVSHPEPEPPQDRSAASAPTRPSSSRGKNRRNPSSEPSLQDDGSEH